MLGIHVHRGKLSGLKLLPFANFGTENLALIYLSKLMSAKDLNFCQLIGDDK